ncbi:uncharacterized protein LOC126902025 [Daktulosphaira vitifoliae]|uniref:uncharacterized protein LOC126902025 n=1 Tax=Daktulosphaira vitifoliae TaxID=58002 RepID=UPI0021AAE94E|nr:uncharacterized protein LOC126902025 [Daktulosphaira vitifoliae]
MNKESKPPKRLGTRTVQNQLLRNSLKRSPTMAESNPDEEPKKMSLTLENLLKIVILGDYKVFNIELVFNLLQRKVFANLKLNVYIVTSDVSEVTELIICIERSAFCNLNEFIATNNVQEAFLNADFLIMMSDLSIQNVTQDMRSLKYIIKKAQIFDQLANVNARVLMMGPHCCTWLQIFAEVTSNLSKENLSGLSRHYVTKAVTLITQKLNCNTQDITGVYIWGPHYLDLVHAEKVSKFSSNQDVYDLLPVDWFDNCLIEEVLQPKTGRHALISAVCHHLHDWLWGSGNKIVSMITIVQKPGDVADGIYSSYPVVIDENRNITVLNFSVSRQKVYDALHWFVAINSLYKDVTIDQNGVISDDDIIRLEEVAKETSEELIEGTSAYMSISDFARIVRASWHQRYDALFTSGYAGV